ncbi:MAG: bifunctional demethylmenaquinone methyltransferase/2-methoxy-6-polyprenyl-1,4-benzoquinol methylase UbiE [Gemmataceae bacterium]
MDTLINKEGERIRRMFGAIAPTYDFLNHLLSLNVDRYWRWRTTRLVPPRAGCPILDLCTGTADLALAYDRAAHGQTPIVAADFCQQMLIRARRKIRRRAAQRRIVLVQADALRLPFRSDCFDIVCVAFGLRNMADPGAGLAEMVRVTRPGGRVAILEFSQPADRGLGRIYRWYFQKLLPCVGQVISRSPQRAYQYLPASVSVFPCGAALAQMMQAQGLRQVYWHNLTWGIATLYVGTK